MKTTYYLTKEELENLMSGEEVVIYQKPRWVKQHTYIEDIVQIKYLPIESEVE